VLEATFRQCCLAKGAVAACFTPERLGGSLVCFLFLFDKGNVIWKSSLASFLLILSFFANLQQMDVLLQEICSLLKRFTLSNLCVCASKYLLC